MASQGMNACEHRARCLSSAAAGAGACSWLLSPLAAAVCQQHGWAAHMRCCCSCALGALVFWHHSGRWRLVLAAFFKSCGVQYTHSTAGFRWQRHTRLCAGTSAGCMSAGCFTSHHFSGSSTSSSNNVFCGESYAVRLLKQWNATTCAIDGPCFRVRTAHSSSGSQSHCHQRQVPLLHPMASLPLVISPSTGFLSTSAAAPSAVCL